MTQLIDPDLKNTFEGFERHFAEYLNSIAKHPSPDLFYAAALSVYYLREGHIRFNLEDYAGTEFKHDKLADSGVILPELNNWICNLSQSGVVGSPGDYMPLIIENNHIYLYRYWNYENTCAELIKRRSQRATSRFSEEQVRSCLSHFFNFNNDDQREQISAALTSIHNQFTVITGGPGTGKTSTVAKIVASMLLLNQPEHFHIALAAPTGKAAMRLSESLSKTRETLELPASIEASFPVQACTIHSLLGTIHGSTTFRYNKSNPLPFNLVIVDEASMIDCALMAKLLNAIPESCQLILLGDKDQLSSVEAGSIFGDICGAGIHHSSTHNTTAPSIRNSITKLEKSFRFRDDAGIGKLSKAINSGSYSDVQVLLHNDSDCTLIPVETVHELRMSLAARVAEWYSTLSHETDPAKALDILDEFRILCALRQGPWGVSSINSMVRALSGANKYHSSTLVPFAGCPVMITTNDYRQSLFNGDTGIILNDGNGLSAFFRNPDRTVKSVNVRMLPAWELAFAITVHKSQGSEFNASLLILPPAVHPLITRELIYTAITRSRKSIELWCTETVLRRGIETSVDRRSGLQDKLWK